MCFNELQMDHNHTYVKDHDCELRILKKKFDLSTFPWDQENNDTLCPGWMLLEKFGQEGNGIYIPLPQDLVAEDEEEGAGFSFMPSQDLAAEVGEEGRTRDLEEVEAQDPGSERSSVVRPELTPDQKTFLIIQKSEEASYEDILRKWSVAFKRTPPSRCTVVR